MISVALWPRCLALIVGPSTGHYAGSAACPAALVCGLPHNSAGWAQSAHYFSVVYVYARRVTLVSRHDPRRPPALFIHERQPTARINKRVVKINNRTCPERSLDVTFRNSVIRLLFSLLSFRVINAPAQLKQAAGVKHFANSPTMLVQLENHVLCETQHPPEAGRLQF